MKWLLAFVGASAVAAYIASVIDAAPMELCCSAKIGDGRCWERLERLPCLDEDPPVIAWRCPRHGVIAAEFV